MKVLVACEYSGRVRDAFKKKGHFAMSCDILPSDVPGKHYQGSVIDIIKEGWDIMIAHPPCTFLSNSGAKHLYKGMKKENGRNEKRWKAMELGAYFFRDLWIAPIPKICIENPIMLGYAKKLIGADYTQIIQPYDFGEDASKSTCLWLNGLMPLRPTRRIGGRIANGVERWSNQTDSGQNRLGPSKDRWRKRAVTYQGIADAFADQWG